MVIPIKGISSQDRNHADKSMRSRKILPQKMSHYGMKNSQELLTKVNMGFWIHRIPSKALACYYNTLCMMIFSPFQKYKFYRIKINKTVESIQMYHTIIRLRVIIQRNVIISWEEVDLVSSSIPDNS